MIRFGGRVRIAIPLTFKPSGTIRTEGEAGVDSRNLVSNQLWERRVVYIYLDGKPTLIVKSHTHLVAFKWSNFLSSHFAAGFATTSNSFSPTFTWRYNLD